MTLTANIAPATKERYEAARMYPVSLKKSDVKPKNMGVLSVLMYAFLVGDDVLICAWR